MTPGTRTMMPFGRRKPLIGVVHLPPLPGYPGAPGLAALVAHALADLRTLEAADFDGVLVENEHDQPHRVLAAPETLAVMTRIAAEMVRAARPTAVGVEILLNDPKASLAAAFAAGGAFIRTDYFVDRMTRPEYGGEMAIDPAGLLAFRRALGADPESPRSGAPRRGGGVQIYADIQVKYAKMCVPRPLAQSAAEARDAGADAVIVTGDLTGQAPAIADLQAASSIPDARPVLIGSGLTVENAGELLGSADGAIVGTGIMTAGRIDLAKAKALSQIAAALR